MLVTKTEVGQSKAANADKKKRIRNRALSEETAIETIDEILAMHENKQQGKAERVRMDIENLMLAMFQKQGMTNLVDRIIEVRSRMGWYE